MDTFKDKQRLDDMNAQGDCPWEVWRTAPGRPAAAPARESRRLPLPVTRGAQAGE